MCLLARYSSIVAAVVVSANLYCQTRAATAPAERVSVPFVGCDSDRQVGQLDAPKGTSVSITAGVGDARQLAYYRSEKGIGALGPRGWHCFGIYGSGGDTLYITPHPIDFATVSFDAVKPDGPWIRVLYRFGGTSGRFSVAEVIARVFPAHRPFAVSVRDELDHPDDAIKSGGFPEDRLIYKSDSLVEYRTPPEVEGLGTFWTKKSTLPTQGAALVILPEHDLALLSVRLPSELDQLAAAIIHQFEHDAGRCPCD